MSYAVPAGKLANPGDVVHIVASGTLAATTDGKAVRLTVGGQLIASLGTSNSLVTAYTIDAVIMKTGSNEQSYLTTFSPQGLNVQAKTGTLTLTDTDSISIQLTGQNTTAATANSVTAQLMTVDYER